MNNRIMGKFQQKYKNFIIKTVINLAKQINFIDINYCAVPSKFLVISTTGIGDTLWGTPAIRALKETYPESYIGVLTTHLGFELLQENPNIDDLFIFKRGLGGFFLLPALLKALRQKKFEVVFIFHASDRIIWPLAFFTGAGRIIGVNGSSKGLDFILTDAVHLPQNLHGVEARLSLIDQVGVTAENKTIEMFLTEQERTWAEIFLRDNDIEGNTLLVGLHPGAQKTYKCWPTDNFVKLGNELIKKFNCVVIVTGNRDEMLLANMVSSQINGAISFAGTLTLRQTAAIIEKMDIFIANDTGPMHIAYALRTPTIALFAPTDPERCGPYRASGPYVVITKPKICNPCIGKKCEVSKCMEQITIEEVLQAAESLLAGE